MLKKSTTRILSKFQELPPLEVLILYTNAPMRLGRFIGDSNNKLVQESLVYSQDGGCSPWPFDQQSCLCHCFPSFGINSQEYTNFRVTMVGYFPNL